MTTQLTAESLSPIIHNQIPVVTTELLAQLYGTEPLNIQVNFTRNKDRFIEGKHFFKTTGDDLKNLRLTLSKSQNEVQISPKTRASSSGQNAVPPATPRCSKPIRRGRCSKNWKIAISARKTNRQLCYLP